MAIAIVGAGINGLSIAKTFAEKGFKVDIYDKSTACSQTSAKSSKLLHGGIRYLENFEFLLVKESLESRSKWIQDYPQDVKITDFIIPIYEGRSKNINYVYFGAKLYQFLSGKNSLGKSSKMSKKQLLNKKLGLIEDKLLGAITYKDVIMDDKSIVKKLKNKLLNMSATINEFEEVLSISKSGALKTKSGKTHYDLIVNACGPWASKLILNSGIETDIKLKGVRGSHLIIDKTISHPILIQDTKDNRVIFVLPFGRNAILGTTEVAQDIEVEPICSSDEEDYLINSYNDYFYESIDKSNIVERYSGVRPLIYSGKDKSLASISRESHIEVSGKVTTLYGGKWTTSNQIGDKVYKKYIRSI